MEREHEDRGIEPAAAAHAGAAMVPSVVPEDGSYFGQGVMARASQTWECPRHDVDDGAAISGLPVKGEHAL